MINPEALGRAVTFAAAAHADQTRKRAAGDLRPRIPYISHLLAVASIVIEDGGDTDEAIAALLHDYIEDVEPHGADKIAAEFGPRVRDIVVGCTGAKKEEIPDFRTRKQRYIDHLWSERCPGVIRVSLADKVHNSRSTVNDLVADGPAMWDRFNAGVADQLWWYGELSAAFVGHSARGRADAARAAEFAGLVTRMRELSTN
ncbi:MAG: HD domain-containing protein [Nocardiaceae bacterium]|nr:HD domain-containing protein [Nocardiaceae bacterium]